MDLISYSSLCPHLNTNLLIILSKTCKEFQKYFYSFIHSFYVQKPSSFCWHNPLSSLLLKCSLTFVFLFPKHQNRWVKRPVLLIRSPSVVLGKYVLQTRAMLASTRLYDQHQNLVLALLISLFFFFFFFNSKDINSLSRMRYGRNAPPRAYLSNSDRCTNHLAAKESHLVQPQLYNGLTPFFGINDYWIPLSSEHKSKTPKSTLFLCLYMNVCPWLKDEKS